jgi:hypothetical protein
MFALTYINCFAKSSKQVALSGGLVINYNGGRVVSLYRDKHSWEDVSEKIREATQIPRSMISQFVVKEPYPEWWIERFGQDSVINEETWQRVVEIAGHFAPDKVTDMQVQLVNYM